MQKRVWIVIWWLFDIFQRLIEKTFLKNFPCMSLEQTSYLILVTVSCKRGILRVWPNKISALSLHPPTKRFSNPSKTLANFLYCVSIYTQEDVQPCNQTNLGILILRIINILAKDSLWKSQNCIFDSIYLLVTMAGNQRRLPYKGALPKFLFLQQDPEEGRWLIWNPIRSMIEFSTTDENKTDDKANAYLQSDQNPHDLFWNRFGRRLPDSTESYNACLIWKGWRLRRPKLSRQDLCSVNRM